MTTDIAATACLGKRLAAGWMLLLLVAGVSGCETCKFYSQAFHGQCQILTGQRPIHGLLADPRTPRPLRDKLLLVLKLRAFAERELKLPANGHYLSYADLKRDHAVWSVYASPEFSLTAKSWWYPVVGRADYRGYFSERAAQDYAAKLEGFDTYVGGVEAYSTLGWFRDPVLNTFIHHDEADLAEILFHELAHQKLYIGGDSKFNEAFATAVAQEGVRRWLRAGRQTDALAKYEVALRRKEQFTALLNATRQRLARVYGEANGKSIALGQSATRTQERREQKQAIFGQLRRDYAQLKASWGGDDAYDKWFNRPLNNGKLNTVETYHHLVPGFRRLLAVAGNHLEQFYAQARALKQLAKDQRQRALLLDVGEATQPQE